MSHPSITSVAIENWKSFRRGSLELANLTLLVGTNASGKSNALEALKLLNWLADGGNLGRFREAIEPERGAFQIRGALSDLIYRNAPEPRFEISCFVSGPGAAEELRMQLQLELADGELRIASESLTRPRPLKDPEILYAATRREGQVGNVIQVAYNNFKRGGKKPIIDCVDQYPVFTQLQSPARFAKSDATSQSVLPDACRRVQQALGAVLFLDPEPNAMRGWADKLSRRLLPNGANVSAVLFALWEGPANRSALLDFVAHLPDQAIAGLTFQFSPRNEVMVRLQESFGGRIQETDAPLLSDGTLRVLSIAAALLSVESGTLVVIEEMDNGVHPSRAGQLLASINKVASARDLRVLLTTHNPAMLDSLPIAAIPAVTVCDRDEDGSSRLTLLEDIVRYPQLVASGPLGQSATRGVLERFVKEAGSDDERIRHIDEWLTSLPPIDGAAQ